MDGISECSSVQTSSVQATSKKTEKKHSDFSPFHLFQLWGPSGGAGCDVLILFMALTYLICASGIMRPTVYNKNHENMKYSPSKSAIMASCLFLSFCRDLDFSSSSVMLVENSAIRDSNSFFSWGYIRETREIDGSDL